MAILQQPRAKKCASKMSTPSHVCRRLVLVFLHIIFSVFHLAPRTPGAQAADTIEQGRNITDGDTLVSAGRSFTLGFFTPAGAPTTRRYVGIWFTVSADNVYWVANRDHPLNDTSGALVMTASGSLVLLDGSGNAVWSSGSTNSPSAGARLLESGNLVVQGQNNGTALWHAFDHPCNTMLPGMKIGKNLWTGMEWYLSSWRSGADPAPGSFRYITDAAAGAPENVLWSGNSTKVYRSGPWNGKRFSGVPEMSSFSDLFTFQLTVSPGEVTYGYVVAAADAPYSRVTVTEAGHVQRLVWDASSRAWHSYFDAPRDDCDYYAKCGPFGLCNSYSRSTSVCGCVQGFRPTSQLEWSGREYTHGCRRNVALDCTTANQSKTAASTDGFAVLRGVKLPDTRNASVDKKVTSLDQCRDRCLGNCSCVAYAAADLDGTGCIIWTNSIVDVRTIDAGQDLYLRLAKSELGPDVTTTKKKLPLPAVIVIAAGSIFLLVLVVTMLLRLRRADRAPALPIAPGRHPAGLIIPSIDYQIIKEATQEFSRSIGQGTFGRVYEGVLPHNESTVIGIPVGKKVAVKVLKQSDINSYERELNLMSKLTHVNLIPLLACCNHGIDDTEGTEDMVLILVYEYMEKGSLDRYVFGDQAKRAALSWTRRLQIITSIAEGVFYLHVSSDKNIIHRDLKPSNILLADDLTTPKIADFGLAKHVTDLTALHTPIGPYGYSAPECWNGETTDKSDIYSFGVVLLEIISGKENGLMQKLLPHAWNSWNNKGVIPLHNLIDPEVPQEEVDPVPLSRLERCIQIGLLCVQESPNRRPDISEVLNMLKTECSIPIPQGPTLREVGEASNTVYTDGDIE